MQGNSSYVNNNLENSPNNERIITQKSVKWFIITSKLFKSPRINGILDELLQKTFDAIEESLIS